ncbi:MAG TPA: HAD family phosphatase [Firmicutes bacterium]|nr:HAD family phosphatase [Bacillota bacterium]
MALNPIRWIILDLDDTLLDGEGRLPEANREAVAEVVARGLPVVLATGRRWSACEPYHYALGLSTPAICFCGADIRRADGVPLRQHRLSGFLALEIIRTLDGAGLPVRVSLEDGSCWTREPPYPRRLRPPRVDPILVERLPHAPYQLVVEGERQVEVALRLLEPLAGQLTLYPIDSRSTGRRRLLILDGAAGKEKAARLVGEKLGLSLDEALAMGDGPVDLELLRQAGTSVAMDIAVPEVKALADLVAPPGVEGVAHALRRLVLGGT